MTLPVLFVTLTALALRLLSLCNDTDMSNITIYHNPACGTSRNTLEMIRNSGTEPTVILYLEPTFTR
jgi:hypothetical protein